MSAVDRLLERMHNVKATGSGRWMAGCPCCQSKRGRPISVRELDNGDVLLHPFCVCTTEAVLAELGLDITALFDKPLGHHIPPTRNRISARDLLAVVSEEIDTAAIILNAVVDGGDIGPVAWQRIAQAAARIGAARGYLP